MQVDIEKNENLVNYLLFFNENLKKLKSISSFQKKNYWKFSSNIRTYPNYIISKIFKMA